MQRLRLLMGGAGNRCRDQRGWVLMDALWSSVVVMMAFVATTMAFNGGADSVARDANKTYAMNVAQKQLEEMRAQGQVDITTLTTDSINNNVPVTPTNGYDGRVETVKFKGIDYTVSYSAYYVTGVGDNTKDACGSPYASNGSTARYIYMRVKVSYAGQLGASGANGAYGSSPAMLDAYFAPEGGAVQANTGTLRIYVLDRNDNVASGISSVSIYQGSPTGSAFQTQNIVSNGCVLFTGLPRATYYVKVSTSKQDLYLSGVSGVVTQKVVMPYRGALSRIVRLDLANKVTATFKLADETPVPADSSSSAFVGPWVAMNDEIVSDPTLDFTGGPGRTYMPHIAGGSNPPIKDQLFPMKNGYSAYAGPCNVNDPDSGSGNEWISIPTNLTDSGWLPGGTYATSLYLSQLHSRIRLSNIPATKPTSGLQRNTKYYWGQILNSGKISARLVGDQNKSGVYEHCGANESLFNSWVRIPGSVNTGTGYLSSAIAEAIPSGTYDVCAYAQVTVTSQSTKSTSTAWNGSPVNSTLNLYRIIPEQTLTYKGMRYPDFNFDQPEAPEGDTTTCSGASWSG